MTGLFAFFLSGTLSAQAGPDDVTESKLKKFWASHIQPIIDLDREKIIDQTNFPLAGEWYAEFDMWESTPEELQEAYVERLDEIFDEEFRKTLAGLTWENLEVGELEDGYLINLPLLFVEEVDGDIYESAMILEFTMINNKWMLTAIMFAG